MPKKDGSHCPVVNLKPLNFEAKIQYEGHERAQEHHTEGRLDGVSGPQQRLSLGSHGNQHRKFLRFMRENELFEFRCLPFGLSSVPCTFMKLLIIKPVMALLRRQGVRVIIFLDDMLMMAQSREQLITQTNAVIKLLCFLFAGVCVKFHSGAKASDSTSWVCLPQEKVRQIIQDC